MENSITAESQRRYFEMAKRDGKLQELPLEYWPVSLDWLESDIYSAFCRMSRQRDEWKPIADQAIEVHAKMHGTCGLHFDDFLALITSIDNSYLEAKTEKWKRDNPKKRD